ncbi:MAG: DNA primase [Syntrophales bacterium]|nr:DNA primase [Syntrophales bacterium]
MKGYIPDIKVEEIKNRASIVDLVSEYVTLKKAGRNFIGLCPFHKEKTPSFTVTPDRQMFYCFGCGEGGGVFTFLMKIGQMTYPEAVRHLAKKTGVVISERISQKERQEVSYGEQLIRINEMATGHYARNLASPSGKEALAYLRKRGIREETARAFRLGFSLNGWHHLRDFLEKEEASLENAEQAGLLVPGKDGHRYDRFRGRLMFPVEDLSGRVIAFGGRILGAGEPKYLNSPESGVYVKGRNLYALNRAKEAIRRQGCVIVVEGYFDLISLWNAGITHVVATLGTALTKEQIHLICRYTTHVVALFDPDEAGRKALTRSLELFLSGNLNARALVLPDGLDPDDYVRAYGGDRLLELINGAPSMVDYYINHVLGDQGGFEKDRDSLRKAVAFIKHIENVVDRNLFIKRVSEKLGIDQELLKKEISRARPPVTDDGTIRGVYTAEIEKLEMGLIHLLLIHPEKIVPVTQTGILDYFTNRDLKNFGETLQSAAAGLQPWDAVERVSRLDPGPIREGLMKKLMEARPLEEEKILDRLIVDTTRQIRRRWYKEKLKALNPDIVKAQETGDTDRCRRLLVEKGRLLKEEKMLGI